MNKRRVTLFLEETAYRALRVMAATEGTSMTNIVEDFIMGNRQNISDPKEIKRIEKENNIEVDDKKAQVFKKDDPIFHEGNEASVSKKDDINIPFD